MSTTVLAYTKSKSMHQSETSHEDDCIFLWCQIEAKMHIKTEIIIEINAAVRQAVQRQASIKRQFASVEVRTLKPKTLFQAKAELQGWAEYQASNECRLLGVCRMQTRQKLKRSNFNKEPKRDYMSLYMYNMFFPSLIHRFLTHT